MVASYATQLFRDSNVSMQYSFEVTTEEKRKRKKAAARNRLLIKISQPTRFPIVNSPLLNSIILMILEAYSQIIINACAWSKTYACICANPKSLVPQ